ncbi:MAG: YetF domain-containing protein [Mycobacterium sp.]
MSGIEIALIGDWHLAAFAALKALALFVTAATAFRFTQRRTLADFTPFDWVTAVAVGAIIGRTATAADTSVLVGAAALLTLMVAHAIVMRLRFRPKLRRLLDPPLRVLVRDGEINDRNLRRNGLTRDDLDAALRQHGHLTPAGVGLAISEQNGSVTVLTAAALADAEEHDS